MIDTPTLLMLAGALVVGAVAVEAWHKYRDPSTGEGWFSAFEQRAARLVSRAVLVITGLVDLLFDKLASPEIAEALKAALGGLDPRWALLLPVLIALAIDRRRNRS